MTTDQEQNQQAELLRLREEVVSLRAALHDAGEIRLALIRSTSDMAKDMVDLLGRATELRDIVKLAMKWEIELSLCMKKGNQPTPELQKSYLAFRHALVAYARKLVAS